MKRLERLETRGLQLASLIAALLLVEPAAQRVALLGHVARFDVQPSMLPVVLAGGGIARQPTALIVRRPLHADAFQTVNPLFRQRLILQPPVGAPLLSQPLPQRARGNVQAAVRGEVRAGLPEAPLPLIRGRGQRAPQLHLPRLEPLLLRRFLLPAEPGGQHTVFRDWFSQQGVVTGNRLRKAPLPGGFRGAFQRDAQRLQRLGLRFGQPALAEGHALRLEPAVQGGLAGRRTRGGGREVAVRLQMGFDFPVPFVPAFLLRQGDAQRKELAGMPLGKLALHILRLLAAQPASQANAVTFIGKGNLQVAMQPAVADGLLIGPFPLFLVTVSPAQPQILQTLPVFRRQGVPPGTLIVQPGPQLEPLRVHIACGHAQVPVLRRIPGRGSVPALKAEVHAVPNHTQLIETPDLIFAQAASFPGFGVIRPPVADPAAQPEPVRAYIPHRHIQIAVLVPVCPGVHVAVFPARFLRALP